MDVNIKRKRANRANRKFKTKSNYVPQKEKCF